MINASNSPTSTNSEAPMMPPMVDPTMHVGIPQASGDTSLNANKKKLFGLDFRSLATVVGLTSFFIVAMAAVVVSLRTRFGEQDFSPTAPETPSANVEQVADCSLTFTVATPSAVVGCTKTAYRDGLANTAGTYQLITEQTTFEPNQVVVFSFNLTNNSDQSAVITATDDLSTLIPSTSNLTFTFLDSDCAGTAYNTTTRILTCTSQTLAAGASERHSFRIRLGNTTTNQTLTNNVAVSSTIPGNTVPATASCKVDITVNPPATPSPTPSPTPTPTPTPTPVVGCNQACVSNGDCANSSHICYYNQCRHIDYVVSPDCRPPSPTPSPSPTPIVGCNEPCTTNANCSNGNHVCLNNYCRDTRYPNSPDCRPPQEVTYVPNQPQLPAQLPKTGAEDFDVWIKAGLGVLAAGTLLLLLL